MMPEGVCLPVRYLEATGVPNLNRGRHRSVDRDCVLRPNHTGSRDTMTDLKHTDGPNGQSPLPIATNHLSHSVRPYRVIPNNLQCPLGQSLSRFDPVPW
jgi:hypothetical protein